MRHEKSDLLYAEFLKRNGGFLTQEEECELGRAMAQGDSTSISARNILIEKHLPLVLGIVGKLSHGREYSSDDLIQAGTEGLFAATKRWEYQRENRFSAYARWYVEDAMRNSMHDTFLISTPIKSYRTDQRIRQTEIILEGELHRSVSVDEISAELAISKKVVQSSLRRTRGRHVASLDEDRGVNGDEEGTNILLNVYENSMAMSPDLLLLAEDEIRASKAYLDDIFARLDADEFPATLHSRLVFKALFGIGKEDEKQRRTLREVARLFSISPQRVQQIIQKVWLQLTGKKLVDYSEPFDKVWQKIELLEEIISAARER